MQKVILFGATGHLGKEVAKELLAKGYNLTAVVRNPGKAQSLSQITSKCVIADVCCIDAIKGICQGQDIVVSTLGKSVSPNDKSRSTFHEVDFMANSRILDDAQKNGVKKFIYISAFHSEKYLELEYFKAHHRFAELVKNSGIDYSIIKPPAIFSAFLDMADLARNGRLVNIGLGDKKTNPIHESDLAKVVVGSIGSFNSTIEVGGKRIYTRKQLNDIIQAEIDRSKKVRTIPFWLFKFSLPLIRIFDKNTFDKFAFFARVISNDTIAPLIGEKNFETYISNIKGRL